MDDKSRRSDRLSYRQSGAGKQPIDFAVLGKPALLFLGEQAPAIGRDFEHAAAAFDQGNLGTGPLFDLGLRTEGSGFVVSLNAIFDFDGHLLFLGTMARLRL